MTFFRNKHSSWSILTRFSSLESSSHVIQALPVACLSFAKTIRAHFYVFFKVLKRIKDKEIVQKVTQVFRFETNTRTAQEPVRPLDPVFECWISHTAEYEVVHDN